VIDLSTAPPPAQTTTITTTVDRPAEPPPVVAAAPPPPPPTPVVILARPAVTEADYPAISLRLQEQGIVVFRASGRIILGIEIQHYLFASQVFKPYCVAVCVGGGEIRRGGPFFNHVPTPVFVVITERILCRRCSLAKLCRSN
jgi:hypothetical protein